MRHFQEMYECLHRDSLKPRDVTLVVHTTPELHSQLAELAERESLSIDDVVNRAFFSAVTASYTQKRSAEIFARDLIAELEVNEISLSPEELAKLNQLPAEQRDGLTIEQTRQIAQDIIK